jgi:hypothetical protein
MHRLQPILEAALGKEMVLPVRKLSSIEEFLERFPGVKEVIIDGTERPIQRPKLTERQQENYSGKKRRHTRKHLAGVAPNLQVLVLTRAREGKLHDKKFHDLEDLIGGIPDEIPVLLDLGFQGVKRYNAVAGIYRNRVPNFDDRLMGICYRR